jgi:hypothetical protein
MDIIEYAIELANYYCDLLKRRIIFLHHSYRVVKYYGVIFVQVGFFVRHEGWDDKTVVFSRGQYKGRAVCHASNETHLYVRSPEPIFFPDHDPVDVFCQECVACRWCGGETSVRTGETVILSGSATDPHGDAIIGWLWKMTVAPAGAQWDIRLY